MYVYIRYFLTCRKEGMKSEGWKNGWMDGWMKWMDDEWMDDEWMDG